MLKNSGLNTEWRKVATAIYRKPVDSKLFGSVEVDVTDLEKYIREKRKEGLKITLTHVMMLTVARALRYDVPELNAYVRRGRIIMRKNVDAMVTVLVDESEMSQVKIRDADRLTLKESAEVMNNEIVNTRKGHENKEMQVKKVLASLPWPLRGMVYRTIKLLIIDLGLSFPRIGLSANNYGSFVLTNIGSIGLEVGFPALMPTSNVAIVVVMGGVLKKPVVIDDQIVPRRVITLTAALDHRVVDAWHIAKLFRYIKRIVKNPQELESQAVAGKTPEFTENKQEATVNPKVKLKATPGSYIRLLLKKIL